MIRASSIERLLAAGLLLVSCSGCLTEDASNAEVIQSPDDERVAVNVLSPERTSLSRVTTQPATVGAYYQAEIYAKVAGYLNELEADIGQQVASGAVLATIDVPEMLKARQRQEATVRRLEAEEKRAAAEITVAQAHARSAQAALEQSRADVGSTDAELKADRIEYERMGGLVQQGAIADRLRDEALERFESAQAVKLAAEAAVVSADANLGVAQAKMEAAAAGLVAAQAQTDVARKEMEESDAMLAYATLRAPFDGRVTQRTADPGDLIRATPASSGRDSPPLFVIAALDKVRVRVAIPERDAPWADAGDPATLTFQALPGRPFSGQVSRIAGSLDESTRTMVVEIDLENADGKLLPGMFGEVTIVLEEHAGSLVLPAGAVRHDESGGSYVYAVSPDGRVKVIDVATGLDDGNTIEITQGLTGDERIVDAMLGRLSPDQEVQIREP